MSRVLLAWELGGGYGHVAALLPLAVKLAARGHEILFALRNVSRAEPLLGRHGFPVVQAPVALSEPRGLPAPVSYAEILQRSGFLTAAALAARVKAWRTLFALARPDLLIANHAPTALLAAHGLPIARARFGTGFTVPPIASPMPAVLPGGTAAAERARQTEHATLDVVNRVLVDLGAPALARLADLLAADETFLCTFPELDHYPHREPARYWGPQFADVEGDAPSWPGGDGRRIFAYLSPRFAGLERLLGNLRETDQRVLVHAPGVPAAIATRYASARVRFSPAPVRMDDVARQCDLVVCHAGHGTVAAALLGGRPLVLAPVWVEQEMTASRVVALGAGASVVPGERTSVKRLIHDVLEQPAFAAGALGFARAHADFSEAAALAAMVDRCEALARRA
jgi:UDP:flavonoid glycosyltransferase YjiC (YdhE family)